MADLMGLPLRSGYAGNFGAIEGRRENGTADRVFFCGKWVRHAG